MGVQGQLHNETTAAKQHVWLIDALEEFRAMTHLAGVFPILPTIFRAGGGIDLADVAFGKGASLEHYTLCRCGASKNKPFCDGSHWNANFKDAG